MGPRWGSDRCGRWAALALLALLGGCRSRPPHVIEALVVESAGCALVRPGPICELDAGARLRLWIPDPVRGARTLVIDRRPPQPLPAPLFVEGGARYALPIPAGAQQIEVREERPRSEALWRLALGEHAPQPALDEAASLRRSRDLDRAAARLSAALPTLPAELADRARADLGRIALARGDAGAAATALAIGTARARAAGRVSDAVNDALALCFVLLVMKEDLPAAGHALDDLDPLVAIFDEGRAQLAYFRGLLAERSGDPRAALRFYREAASRAAQLDLPVDARQELALMQAWIGRADEAMATERALLAGAANEPPCARAEWQMNLAWMALLAHWSLRGSQVDPAPLLAEARAAVLASCPDPFRQRNALLNEALYAIEVDDRGLARQRLRELEALAGGRTALVSIWEAELAGRLALADRQPRRALPMFARQVALASAVGFGDGRVRGLTGQGRALLALGREREAIARFQEAEAAETDLVGAVPLGEGRDLFAGGRLGSARELVTALLEVGRTGEAARAARVARARALVAAAHPVGLEALPPEARERWLAAAGSYRTSRARLEAEAADDWKLSAAELGRVQARRAHEDQAGRVALDEAYAALGTVRREATLAAPAEGELDLVYFPLHRGWVAFALTATGARAERFAALDLASAPTALATQLLVPFTPELAAAHSLRVIAYGAIETVDLHALPFQGAPLIDRLPVTYSLDIGARDATLDGAALVLADPTGDLPGSAREGAEVAAALAPRPLHLLRGEQATREQTLALLPHAALFHYAGHAGFAGADGLDSSLRLTAGARLSAGDLLALPRAPALVVVSACDAARTASAGAVTTGALGIAQAFVLAGARSVLAPTRPVRDALAAALIESFYREGRPPSALHAAEALRSAVRVVRQRFPTEDWSSFRVLSP